MKKLVFVLILSAALGSAAGGQTLPWEIRGARNRPAVNRQQEEAYRRLILDRESRRRFEFMQNMWANQQRGGVTVSTYSVDIAKKVKNYLQPEDSVRDRYREFLKLPATGLVTLWPERSCPAIEKESFEKMLKRCPSTFALGGARYFSFRKNDYVSSPFADLGYKDDWIFSLGIFNQGVLVNLGDVPLEKLTLRDEGLDFLDDFVPAVEPAAADAQYKQFEDGLTVDGRRFRQVLPVEVGRTFALRVVAYRAEYFFEREVQGEKHRFYPLADDPRRDVIVAFRIVDRDADGKLTLAWRKLTERPAPELATAAVTGEPAADSK